MCEPQKRRGRAGIRNPRERGEYLIRPGLVCVCLVFFSFTGWMMFFSYSVGKMAIKSTRKKKKESDNPNNYFQKISAMCTLQVCF